MRRENLRIIGGLLVFVVLAVLAICFDDIKVMINEAMVEQADSLMNQLLR